MGQDDFSYKFDKSPPEGKLLLLELMDQLTDLYGFERHFAEAIAPILDKHLEVAINTCPDAMKEIEALPGFAQASSADRAKMSAIAGAMMCSGIMCWLETDNRLTISNNVLRMGIMHTHFKRGLNNG